MIRAQCLISELKYIICNDEGGTGTDTGFIGFTLVFVKKKECEKILYF